MSSNKIEISVKDIPKIIKTLEEAEKEIEFERKSKNLFIDDLYKVCEISLKQDKEIERLNNRLKTSNDTCNYLRNTIDKAIEYIDRRDIEWGSEEHNILLSILKGSDKE